MKKEMIIIKIVHLVPEIYICISNPGDEAVGPESLCGDLPDPGLRLRQTRGHHRHGEGHSRGQHTGDTLQVPGLLACAVFWIRNDLLRDPARNFWRSGSRHI